ncbi:hypothetical protein GCM10010112_92360 [Actinoplanes lobatus]|uniref:Uncharacterized protein n=1 Tax=Actinoplanes lobatus TaxID=113568 RepID=A0A7W7HJQ2_9ACTN|nr:hypothetical protein [Actinoplanes lobatus]MBB4751806.1 hypothetical protein [Actinoplanes lobatus]GGN98979.1 hypothetical protein GCM10010112_92360 [Actinoplanes lobatus]GIE46249.1 hypothetical protein Alo02nite_91470 [Actinoplanes lobatus]
MVDQSDRRRDASAEVAVPEFRQRVFTGDPSSVPAAGRPTIPLPGRPVSLADAPAAPTVRGRRPPPDVGRVVLIYEQVRRPWRLLGFTAVLVSLTVGVILGQTEAYQQPSPRAAATAQPVPSDAIPAPVPLTAPLGAVKQRRLEITGAATSLRIRTAALGESLFTVAALDPNVAPQLTESADGSLLALAPGAVVTAGAEVVLNSTVAWTLKVTDGVRELDVDARAGGLAGFALAGDVPRGALTLSKPKGTVPLTVTGTLGELIVRTQAGAPIRIRLDKGAGSATINGAARRDVKAGVTLRETGWATATGRYDARVTTEVKSVLVEH